MKVLPLLTLALVAIAATSGTAQSAEKMTFYVYPHDVLKKSTESVDAVRRHFQEIKSHVGASSQFGIVGIALVHPYTAFVAGQGPDHFRIPAHFATFYGRIAEAAQAEAMPLLVCFNGAQWASVEGPYNEYWKLKDGGRYLSRYIDGRVNESLESTDSISAEALRPFLSTGPYGDARNALFLTHSPLARELRASRLRVLRLAASMWKKISTAHRNVDISCSTDSEVAGFSFRSADGKMVPIGYEKLLTDLFKQSATVPAGFFQKERFTYETELEKKWFLFRATTHRSFVQDSVDAIRAELGDVVIYTHQIPTPDGEYVSANGHDFASPQRTAFVKGSRPGFTIYVHGRQDDYIKKVSAEIGRTAGDGHWAAVEFNPGKQWTGTPHELTEYTTEILRLLHRRRCRVIAPIAWESNALDQGIRDSGVDAGIRQFLKHGP